MMIHGDWVTQTNSQIKSKTSMLKSRLCDYSDTHIYIKQIITVSNMAAAAATTNDGDEKVIFKNYVAFADYISKINNAQIDNAEDVNV